MDHGRARLGQRTELKDTTILNIAGNTQAQSAEQSDVVGRFRSGYQIDGEPAGLQAFRVTSGDEAVLKVLAKSLGVDKDRQGEDVPREWDATGEDYLELFTSASAVDVVLESAGSYRSSLVRRTRDGDFMYSTDGSTILAVGTDYEDEFTVGDPSPEAKMDLETIKAKAKKGLAASPDIRVRFTLRDHPELGTFEFRSGGWSLVLNDPEPKLRRLPEGPILAQLKLTEVVGKKFTWTKPELVVRKSLAEGVNTADKPAGYSDDTPF